MVEASRIISVQPHLRYGGSERQSVLLANELNRRGVETTVVEFSSGGGLEQLLDPEIELIDLGLENHLLLPIVARRLYRALSKLPPSLVILKLWSALYAGFMIEKYLPQHRFIYTEDLDPSNHAEFTRLGKFKQSLIRGVFTRRDNITANTVAVKNSMMSVYGLKIEPQVISSAIDFDFLDAYDPETESTAQYKFMASAPDGVMTVASVGSLIERKGLRVTLNALTALESPVRWLIMGEGPQLAEIQSWGSPNLDILAVGGLARPFDVVRNCDLLIHSALSEAFGIAVLESLGVGVPVINSETIGGREIAETLGPDERFLTTYPIGDAEGLHRLVSAHRQRLAARQPLSAFRRYIEPYSLTYTADAWIELSRRAFA